MVDDCPPRRNGLRRGRSKRRPSIQARLLAYGMVLVAGGFNGEGWLRDAELYEPRPRTVEARRADDHPSRARERVLLGDGRVLVRRLRRRRRRLLPRYRHIDCDRPEDLILRWRLRPPGDWWCQRAGPRFESGRRLHWICRGFCNETPDSGGPDWNTSTSPTPAAVDGSGGSAVRDRP
jgi:hypothetical protein